MTDKERRILDITRIPIPSTYFSYDSPHAEKGLMLNVAPRNNEWLISTDRAFAETNSTIEGFLLSTEQVLTSEEDSKLKKDYGVDTEISKPLSRFLAYLEIYREYGLLINGHENRLAEIRTSYEAEKERIYRTTHPKGKAIKKIGETYRNTYEQLIANESNSIQASKQVEARIFRKAAVDFFSQEVTTIVPLQMMPKVLTEARILAKKVPEDKGRQMDEEITGFLEGLGEYIKKTKDSDLFANYSYKKTKGIVQTSDDTSVLSTALTYALSPDLIELPDNDKNLVNSLSRSYIIFLRNRAISTSVGLAETYPRLTLIYDTLTSALSTGQTEVVNNVTQEIIDGTFNELTRGKGIKDEAKVFAQRLMESYVPFDERTASVEYISPEIASNFYLKSLDELPASLKELAVKDEFRIFVAFVHQLSHSKDFERLRLKIREGSVKDIYALVHKSFTPDFRRKLMQAEPSFMHKFTVTYNLPFQDIYTAVGITEDLVTYISSNKRQPEHIYVAAGEPKPKGTTREDYEKLIQIAEESGNQELLSTLLYEYCHEFLDKNDVPIKRVEKQNSELANEITNYQKWFVSPRGDRFSGERDVEISNIGLSSIVFNVDPKYPREYKVAMVLETGTKPFNFWIDKNGKLLDGDRSTLIMSSAYRQLLTNVLLKRLYVITSGKLSESEEFDNLGEGEFKRITEWRRAHYRIYKEDSRVTLNSISAENHAALILKDYGINIWDEIERRRKVGSLTQKQVMTFVREVKPQTKEGDEIYAPNEVPFDPEWVPAVP